MIALSQLLEEDRLYLVENGRVTCGRMLCAGFTAAVQGRTIEGGPVTVVTLDEARTCESEGVPLSCEGCGRGYGRGLPCG